ncbi:MAG: hypothetical protein ACKVU1_05180 [bacterium]
MNARLIPFTAALAVAAIAVTACGKNSTGPNNDGNGGDYDPVIPTSWASAVTNAYFPLVPGTTFEYEAETDEGTETIAVEVLSATRVVSGVTATIVRDRVYLDGELIEDTFDWFAQDAAGNVWYLGEDSKEIENDEVVSTEGSWEWGVDDALPGIIMWADPAAHIGETYRQEFYEGEAEDFGKVVAVNEAVTVPQGSFAGCVKIEEWSGLEPGVFEHKYYSPLVGKVLGTHVGVDERVELVELIAP